MKLKIYFKKIIFNIKCKFQKLHRGYSDEDIWSINCWFLDIMPKMLKQLKETRYGSPCLYLTNKNIKEEDCHKVWSDILDRMVFLLNEMDEDKCSYKNPYQNEYEEYLKKRFDLKSTDDLKEDKNFYKIYIGEEQNKWNYINSCKQEFFDLFSKYFYDLWD